MFFVKIPTKPSSGAGEPLALTCFGCFSSKSPENRHPERSASQIYRVTQRLWRGVEGPRRCLFYLCCSELFNHSTQPDSFQPHDALLAGRTLPARISHPPNRLGTVVRNQQRTILSHHNAHRPAPHFAVGKHKPGEEIFILAGSLTMIDGNSNHLIPPARIPVPGP